MRLSSLLLIGVSALGLFSVGGCSQAGKTTPARMTGMRETTRAWISESSLSRFSDTARLPGSRPGLPQDYEGWVDDRVGVRFGSVAPGDAGYEGEAEWTVEFAEPMAKLAAAGRLNGSAKVRLRGMIGGRELRALSHPGRAPWAPSSLGNNVLTDGGTPWTTLSQLDQAGDRFQVEVRLRSRTGKHFLHYSPWSDVGIGRKAPSETVLSIAGSFAALSAKSYPQWSDVRLLNLGGQGKHSGFMEEPGRARKGLAGALASPLESLENAARGGMGPSRLRTRMARQISAYDAGIVGRIEMELKDGESTVGRATLNLVSEFSAE